jgi:6-phosphogluconolactonase (cycloisomerase 2 family)
MISNRQDKSSSYQKDGQNVASDTLTTFRPVYQSADGSMKLELVQTYPAGGSNPRHFAFNKVGTMVAVPLQDDGKLVIISRDPDSGLLKEIVATGNVAPRPNMVVWDEL